MPRRATNVNARLLALILFATLRDPAAPAACFPELPQPEISLEWVECRVSAGEPFVTVYLWLRNWAAFPEELFEGEDVPCGARTWAHVFDQDGRELMGFCGLGPRSFDPEDNALPYVWFGILDGQSPPEEVYVTFWDTMCDLSYASNRVRLTEFDRGTGIDFRRGDANASGSLDVSDAIRLLGTLFGIAAGSPLCLLCADAADTNDDGQLNITDPIFLLQFLFLGGPSPPAPFPECGPDPTAVDGISCGVYGNGEQPDASSIGRGGGPCEQP